MYLQLTPHKHPLIKITNFSSLKLIKINLLLVLKKFIHYLLTKFYFIIILKTS
nr:MAG TPA: hypothetical protein [Caudoviricetes sp.]